ncbi:hypothetical protein [Streptomyces coeruleorubidus]|uniref:DUF4260 family protein n=1 Tax=Streptomyces coeruleorubidus TaxID=116188 RepID=A0A5J6II43_STRC4|nr:hypothetical protein [Streptomyces coeruleorubidus]QEV28335.1 hypothetical protein CP976_32280 [Streptomyces coeruleorubidus]GGT60154.1 hypothetical protein GCM10010256_16850 [Streptomyces coeruleorubidus]
MDQANPFETPRTYSLHRAEYLVGFAVTTGLMIAHFDEIRWLPAIALFLYIDLIGYIPGAIAFRRSGGRPIHKAYYVLYNVMHSLITQAAVAALWCWLVKPEWALLVLPFHLFGDRGLFGNFMKSFALPFEPVRQPGYLRLLDDLGLPHPKPVGHVTDPVPVGHVPVRKPVPAPRADAVAAQEAPARAAAAGESAARQAEVLR